MHARTGAARQVLEALKRTIESLSPDAERITFPPVMPREVLDRVGYFRNFPQLVGTIACFCGDERAHRELLKGEPEGLDWARACEPSDLVMTPAACYPLYPLAAEDGDAGPSGRLFHVSSWCFRREPSREPGRLQSFEMHEYVRIGSAEQVLAFRRQWMDAGTSFVAALGLASEIAVANDPFFGRAAGVMAGSQRSLELKYELLARVGPEPTWAACMSFNYHQDHFGQTFDLRCGGEIAHTACVGFGLDRLALALFQQHGPEPRAWPASVRAALGFTTPAEVA